MYLSTLYDLLAFRLDTSAAPRLIQVDHQIHHLAHLLVFRRCCCYYCNERGKNDLLDRKKLNQTKRNQTKL